MYGINVDTTIKKPLNQIVFSAEIRNKYIKINSLTSLYMQMFLYSQELAVVQNTITSLGSLVHKVGKLHYFRIKINEKYKYLND